MNKSQRFAKECVNVYGKYDESDDFYSLDAHDLPDFVQDEFASFIMADDESYAAEATGPDNTDWDLIMLPTLMRYLKNSTNREETIEFSKTWRNCITRYCINKIQELIDQELIEYNFDKGFAHSPSNYYGVPAHGAL